MSLLLLLLLLLLVFVIALLLLLFFVLLFVGVCNTHIYIYTYCLCLVCCGPQIPSWDYTHGRIVAQQCTNYCWRNKLRFVCFSWRAKFQERPWERWTTPSRRRPPLPLSTTTALLAEISRYESINWWWFLLFSCFFFIGCQVDISINRTSPNIVQRRLMHGAWCLVCCVLFVVHCLLSVVVGFLLIGCCL